MYGLSKHHLQLLLVISASLVAGQDTTGNCFGEVDDDPNARAVQPESDYFGLDLFRRLAIALPHDSLFISPYSIWSVLGLAYLGAGGKTETQLASALFLGPTKTKSFRNRAWLNFLLNFSTGSTVLRRADKAYFSDKLNIRTCMTQALTDVELVNFDNTAQAANTINNHISQATEGKIKDFLSPAGLVNAKFVLINAVFFKGTWQNQFDKRATVQKPFTDEQKLNELGKVDMMETVDKFNYVKSATLGAEIMELPYNSSMVSMYVILPELKKTSIDSVLGNLDYRNFEEAISSMKKTQAIVGLPKFKMTTRLSTQLKKVLGLMGIVDLFVPGKSDLRTFTTAIPLNVDAVLHQATVEVNEEGTVAAAATGLTGTLTGLSSLVKFSCNRPFIFLLRDKTTKTTLFAGVYRNPKDTQKLP